MTLFWLHHHRLSADRSLRDMVKCTLYGTVLYLSTKYYLLYLMNTRLSGILWKPMVDRFSSLLLHVVKGSSAHNFWINSPGYSLIMVIPSMKMASRRKRALTMPLTKPATIFWRRQKSVDQSQSILFRKLPLEVRELIYEYTSYFPDRLGVSACRKGLDVHIFSHSRKLFWRRCSSVDGSCTPHCYRKFYGYSPLSLNLLAVILTCRRM